MKKVILTCIIFGLLFTVLHGQPQNLTRDIDRVVDKLTHLDQFSGTIFVAKEGRILYSTAVGEANKDFDIENTINTKFNIGSIVKTFTSAAIMILAQKELLKVSDPVKKHLPEFPFSKEITIHHLLTHTAGFGNYMSNPESKNKTDIQGLLELIYKEQPMFNPGEAMAYSNSGIIILGAVIEAISDKSYAEFLQQNIFSPLKMKNTSYSSQQEVMPNRATGYIKRMKGGFYNNSTYLWDPSPAGGIFSTVGDLLKFDQALYGEELLSSDCKKIMFTPFKNRYAYCWGVFERFNNTVITHSGGATGVNAWFRRYTNDKYTVIVLSNYDGGAETLFFTSEAILFGRNYSMPRASVGELLYPILETTSVEEVKKNIQDILKENSYQITDSETLNAIGYSLLKQEDKDMSIKFFELNTDLFPDDANIFDSLGEAYMKTGNKNLAIKNFKKSLKLNPQNANAVLMLENLMENNSQNK